MDFKDLTWDAVQGPGLYIVTLNNIHLLPDRERNPIYVNYKYCKIGQTTNLFGRYCVVGENHVKVFRPENVNFYPLFSVCGNNIPEKEMKEILRGAESCIYKGLGVKPVKGSKAWLKDIEAADLVERAINALTRAKIPFKLFRRVPYVDCGLLPSLGKLTLMFV